MIELQNIHKNYTIWDKKNLQEIPVLKGISLTIPDGDFIAIMGPSGSGKSTLMNIIGMLDIPSSGNYSIDGIQVENLNDKAQSKIRRERIGFVFQNYSLIPSLSNIEQVMLPLIYQGYSPKEARKRAQIAMKRVGLEGKEESSPSALSGGQRQRIPIARAIVIEPSLLLADEPTWALDSTTGQEILDIFGELHAQGNTIVMITHDSEVASRAKRVIRIRDGIIDNM